MSADGDLAAGDPDGTVPDVDRLVLEALSSGLDPEQVAERLRSSATIEHAEVRPGLVKTHPPLAELVVTYATEDGGTRGRVYDLQVVPGQALRVAGTHPDPPARSTAGDPTAHGTGDTPVTPP